MVDKFVCSAVTAYAGVCQCIIMIITFMKLMFLLADFSSLSEGCDHSSLAAVSIEKLGRLQLCIVQV